MLAQMVKNLPATRSIPGSGRLPWTEEPGGLQSKHLAVSLFISEGGLELEAHQLFLALRTVSGKVQLVMAI